MTGRKPFVIGLTGSIGMGKTTTAQMFADLGTPVWDADMAVARLYTKGGGAVQAIATLYPAAVQNGAVNKEALRSWIVADDTALAQIEVVVHPLVAADRAEFLQNTDASIVVLDIPLLIETGGDMAMDLVVVVSASPDIQRARVMARPDMTTQRFAAILAKQTPDAEKRARADVVISTETLESARQAVQELVSRVRENLKNA